MALANRGVIDLSVSILTGYYHHAGAAYGPGLAIAHALRCTKHVHYDDAPEMRVIRNLILYGPPGSCKSAMSKYFLRKMAGAIDLFDTPAGSKPPVFSRPCPKYVTIASGSGFERARGTFSADGNVMAPLFQEADWIYAPELLTALGHDPRSRAERIEAYNGITEERRVSVTLAKGGNKSLEERIEIANTLQQRGYTYDPHRAAIVYDCTAAFMGCTRFLSDAEKRPLMSSGYWTRHSISEFRVTDDIARVFADNKYGDPPSAATLAEVREKWLDLWNTPFETVNRPPRDMLLRVVAWYNEQLAQIPQEARVNFSELYSGRDDGDIAQLMTAACINRLSASRAPGDCSPVPRLEYTKRDEEQATAWLYSRLAHLRNLHDSHEDQKEADAADRAFQFLEAFVKAERDRGEVHHDSFNSKAFVAFGRAQGKGNTVVRGFLTRLRRSGHVSPLPAQPGEYLVDTSALERMGIEVREDRDHAHPHREEEEDESFGQDGHDTEHEQEIDA